MMAQAVARLRASKMAGDDRSKEAGHKDGSEYMLKEADYSEAKELAKIYERWKCEDPNYDDAWVAGEIWSFLTDRAVLEQDDIEIRERLGEDGIDHDAWALGFLDGAATTWAQLASEVNK